MSIKKSNGNLVREVRHAFSAPKNGAGDGVQILRSVIKRSKIMIFRQDRSLCYDHVLNPIRVRNITDYIGKRDKDIFPADNARILDRLKKNAMSSGKTVKSHVFLTHRKRKIKYGVTILPIYDGSKKISGIIGTMMDLSGHEEKQPLNDKQDKAVRLLKKYKETLEKEVAGRTSKLIKTNELLKKEIEKQSKIKKELSLRNTLLKLETKSNSHQDYLNGIIRLIHGWMGIKNVAIHVIENNRLIYGSFIGFSNSYAKNNNLDKATLNSSFQSIAVVPLKYKKNKLGVLYLADKRAGLLSDDKMDLLEMISWHTGEALYKLNLEDKITREQAKLEAFFTHSITPLVFLDRNFNFIRVNNAYARSCGRKVSDFYGKNHFELYPNKENQAIFERVVETGIPFQISAKPFVYPDHPELGVTYWDWTLFPIIDKNGETDFLVLSLKDVTENRLAESRLQEAEKALQNSQRLSDIGRLAATVAHELRNPLAAIYMAASNIKRKAGNPALDKHFDSIHTKVTESEQIINNLLYYSKLRTPSFTTVDLYSVLDECIMINHTNHSANIKLIRRYDIFKKTAIHADSVQMKELLNNLISNAVDAITDGEGKLEIVGEILDLSEKTASITIRDTGEGIEAENLEKIFEPFYSTRSKGTGLGLSVCQEIVKLHRGSILVNSERNKGTLITVLLPLEQY
jgi:PAS domain S-box-containing protein